MTTEWHPVKEAQDVPEGRVVQVMLRGGVERLALRVVALVRLGRSRIEVALVVDLLEGEELFSVIAWRDVPGHEPVPLATRGDASGLSPADVEGHEVRATTRGSRLLPAAARTRQRRTAALSGQGPAALLRRPSARRSAA